MVGCLARKTKPQRKKTMTLRRRTDGMEEVKYQIGLISRLGSVTRRKLSIESFDVSHMKIFSCDQERQLKPAVGTWKLAPAGIG